MVGISVRLSRQMSVEAFSWISQTIQLTCHHFDAVIDLRVYMIRIYGQNIMGNHVHRWVRLDPGGFEEVSWRMRLFLETNEINIA